MSWMPVTIRGPRTAGLGFLMRSAAPAVAKFSTKMSFTITRNLEQLPSYSMLRKLAEQNDVRLTGDERTGSFASQGVEGNYEFGEDGIHGTFAGRGLKGQFSFEIGKAAISITDKPFWLPETLLKQKLMEGLDSLCSKLAGTTER